MFATPVSQAPVTLPLSDREILAHIAEALSCKRARAGDRSGPVLSVADHTELSGDGLLPIARCPARSGLDAAQNKVEKRVGQNRAIAERKALEALPLRRQGGESISHDLT
ncbi:hypothetical protein SSA02_22270 [Swaminathania salitolerans]|uniref:Uncharacterized protein n=1 Tax=Swaminathania salitolerans TaxID=182838 RepID=A0A511BU72_9PROT|nr:hypothetical protein SSA02_22270 [Swaminathania salitolerans]